MTDGEECNEGSGFIPTFPSVIMTECCEDGTTLVTNVVGDAARKRCLSERCDARASWILN